jgi:hypothetical protein
MNIEKIVEQFKIIIEGEDYIILPTKAFIEMAKELLELKGDDSN